MKYKKNHTCTAFTVYLRVNGDTVIRGRNSVGRK